MRRYRRRNLGVCYPGYRYCGPGCTGPGAPTNPVDACCKWHDECYERYGRSMYCDVQFQRCLHRYMNSCSKMGRDARFFHRVINVGKLFY